MPPVTPPPARTRAVLLRVEGTALLSAVVCEGFACPATRRLFDSSRRSGGTCTYRNRRSRMPFFYATRRDGDRVEILGRDARHLAGPLRARPGELIAVVDPAGSVLTVKLDSVSSREVAGSVVASRPHDPEPRLQVTMALALLPAAALGDSPSRA